MLTRLINNKKEKNQFRKKEKKLCTTNLIEVCLKSIYIYIYIFFEKIIIFVGDQ